GTAQAGPRGWDPSVPAEQLKVREADQLGGLGGQQMLPGLRVEDGLADVRAELPWEVIAQVRESVFDTETGQHLLVPQGARLIGLYDHQMVYGQERVLVTWKRVLFPNGTSLSLKDGMPGTDAAGAAGFNDQVNHHLVRVFGNALLLSIISAGVQLSQIPDFGRGFAGPSAGNVLGAAVGQELGQTSAELIRRG